MALKTKHGEVSFGVGDVVRVHHKVGDRVQIFKGTVIAIRGRGINKTFTVRRIGAQKIGIEQIFPLSSPLLTKIEVVREGMRGVRRAKLYYIRNKSKREVEKIYSRAKRRSQVKAKKVTKKTSKK
jgi:large subunit ribosomal protein L19